jgi:phosphonatase-like hydrolase
MSPLDLVVFDIAGTTIRASDQVPAAFRDAFARVDVTLSDRDIQEIRGRSKREAIAELLNRHLGDAAERADPTRVYGDFREILTRRYASTGVEAIDGAEATFDWLKGRGVSIALSTGFDRGLAELLINMVGWTKTIDVLVCNDDVRRGRPAPYLLYRAMEKSACEDVRRVAAVGDTISDLQAANNARVQWSIGVLSGAHGEGQLGSCPHTAIIASVADLPGVFE